MHSTATVTAGILRFERRTRGPWPLAALSLHRDTEITKVRNARYMTLCADHVLCIIARYRNWWHCSARG